MQKVTKWCTCQSVHRRLHSQTQHTWRKSSPTLGIHINSTCRNHTHKPLLDHGSTNQDTRTRSYMVTWPRSDHSSQNVGVHALTWLDLHPKALGDLTARSSTASVQKTAALIVSKCVWQWVACVWSRGHTQMKMPKGSTIKLCLNL